MNTHVIKHNPKHVTMLNGDAVIGVPNFNKNSKYSYSLEVPHFLNYNNSEAKIISSNDNFNAGDLIQNEYEF